MTSNLIFFEISAGANAELLAELSSQLPVEVNQHELSNPLAAQLVLNARSTLETCPNGEEAQPESEMFHDTTCDKECSNQ